jgi:GT2 family glycosyltransferase
LRSVLTRDPDPTTYSEAVAELDFSVIIPAYQAAAFVGTAVASALEQTYPPHEVIVVDDGSTDELEEALDPYLGRIVLHQQANSGLASARNAGLRRSTGDWVVLLDADDFWAPNRLEQMAKHIATHSSQTVITTDAIIVDADGNPMRRYYEGSEFPRPTDQRREILRRNFIFVSAAAPREAVCEAGGFDTGLEAAEDWDLWIRMIRAGAVAGLVEAPLAYYRRHQTNMSSNSIRMSRAESAVMDRVIRSEGVSRRDRRIASHQRRLAMSHLARAAFASAVSAGRSRRRAAVDVAFASDIDVKTRLRAVAGVCTTSATERW